LAALKSNIPIRHIESGLRSNDWKIVEEHYRKIVDHISDVLLSPTEVSSMNLKNSIRYWPSCLAQFMETGILCKIKLNGKIDKKR
jgi:UDP-N-acetylglucosamine 2-epimerase